MTETQLVVAAAPPPPPSFLTEAARALGTAPAGGLTLVQTNNYISDHRTNTTTTTTTNTNNTETNNGNGGSGASDGDRDDDEEEEERPNVPLLNYPEGSRLGKCFYAKCKQKEILRDYGATGVGCSYYCCRHSCGGEVVHAACARAYSFEPGNMGRLIERPCTRCGNVLVIRTEVAFLQAIFYFLIDWPWWLLSRVVPAILVAGFLYKLLWFLLVVISYYPVDTFSNPALVRQDPITGDTIGVRPRLTLSSFGAFNFCKPSGLDIFCPVFQTGCAGMMYCSHGGFTMIKFYRLRMLGLRWPWPVPFFESGHLWCAMYFGLYVAAPIYYFVYRWRWPQRMWVWSTAKFQRTAVTSKRFARPRRRKR